jgi:hypothetical protein
MRPTAFIAAFWLAALPAFGQTAGQSPVPETTAPPAEPNLPLAAMRHQQPRRDEVEKLEQERLGAKAQQIQQQQGPAVDRLYEDVMRRSAPGASGQP